MRMAAAAARLRAVALSGALLVLVVGVFSVSGAEVPNSSSAPSSSHLGQQGAFTSRRPSVERELDAARAAIRRAARRHGNNASSAPGTWFRGDDVDYALLARVYRNPAAFHR